MLTDQELASLLQIDRPLVARLVKETALPRVVIADEVRFITMDVLSWLGEQPALLVPESAEKSSAAANERDTMEEAKPFAQSETIILPAEEDEVPFVSRDALTSLGHHAVNPSHNLARQQVRDGLAALGDALHPTLIRLSNDRLYPSPSEADRTSPWRLDDSMECIDSITMTWAEGDGPPGFEDRPRVFLSVTADAVEFGVRAPNTVDGPGPQKRYVNQARAEGAMIANLPKSALWSVTYLYEVARGAPTASALVSQLTRDAKTIVPLWLGAGEGGRDG